MKIFVVFFVLILSFLRAENLEELLLALEQENDLSHKTKKELAGNLIVYTRQDLDKMQIKSLSELLKNIPYYRYEESVRGFSLISSRYNKLGVTNHNTRIYINERELSTPFFEDTAGLIAKIDFGFVDHVEIYYGATSFEFGIEPAKIIVKIYTKDSSRENGGVANINISSYGSSEGYFSYANTIGDFSFYAYANKKNTKEKKLHFLDAKASKDRESNHFYISLENDNHKFEYNKIDIKADLFLLGKDYYLNKNRGKYDYNFLAYNSKWLDEKLNLSLDYVSLYHDDDAGRDIDKYFNKIDEKTLNKYGYIIDDLTLATDSYQKYKEEQLSAILKYKESFKNNDFLFGTYFRKKDFKAKKVLVRDINRKKIGSNFVFEKSFRDITNFFHYIYDGEKIYGIFLEDNVKITNNQMLLMAFKYDKISLNTDDINKKDLKFARFGYVYANEDLSFKAFYTNYDINFDFFIIDGGYISGANSTIKHENNQNLSLELLYKKNKSTFNTNIFYEKVKYHLYDTFSSYKNSDEPYITKGLSLTYTYDFDLLNKISSNIFTSYDHNKQTNEKDSYFGGYIRLLNTLSKFDIYNELVFRGGYEGFENGYDYNFALTYKFTKNFLLYAKGENIFNKATKNRYLKKDYLLNEKIILENISSPNRRFLLGFEYNF